MSLRKIISAIILITVIFAAASGGTAGFAGETDRADGDNGAYDADGNGYAAPEHDSGYFDEPFIDISVYKAPDSAGIAAENEKYESLKREIRDQIAAFPQNGKRTVTLSFTGSRREIEEWRGLIVRAYYNAVYDYPEELYFAETGLSWSTATRGSECTVELSPNMDLELLEDIDNYKSAVDAACIDCFGSAAPENSGMTELEMVITAHDWIVANCRYDPYIGNNGTGSYWISPGGEIFAPSDRVYTSYGVFVERSAVCQGYALAFKALMDRAGVPCFYVQSEGMQHGWNIVQLNGKWYHIDCTWDDPIYYGSVYDFAGHVERGYLLLSDYEINAKDHYGWSTEYEYECDDPFDMPDSIEDASGTPVFPLNGELYLADENGHLYSYTTGTDFSDIAKSFAISEEPDTAVFDKVNRVYYIGTYRSLYSLDIANKTLVKFADYETPGSGIYLYPNGDGTSLLAVTYAYRNVQEFTTGNKLRDFTFVDKDHVFVPDDDTLPDNCILICAGYGSDGRLADAYVTEELETGKVIRLLWRNGADTGNTDDIAEYRAYMLSGGLAPVYEPAVWRIEG